MNEQPLFDPPPQPDGEPTNCDDCGCYVLATVDQLRIRGWVAYNGQSFTGKPMEVRLCPVCRAGV